MCILIKQPAGHRFTKREVKAFWSRNSDGFGIMYGDGKDLHTLRMVGGFKTVWRNYQAHAAGKDCLLHWRMATHGAATPANAHPFMVTPEIALMHNGCLDMGNPVFKTWTDTQHLVHYFLKPIAEANPDTIFDPEWGKMLGTLIGSSNRLAFAHADGRTALINASYGVTYRGCWYSNVYAWDAPASLLPSVGKSYRYSSQYHDKWAGQGEETADTVDMSEDDQGDTAYASLWADEMNLDDAARCYFKRGTIELAEWCRMNRDDAADIMFTFYEMKREDALELLDNHMAEAVSVLEEIINAERDEDDFAKSPLYAEASAEMACVS